MQFQQPVYYHSPRVTSTSVISVQMTLKMKLQHLISKHWTPKTWVRNNFSQVKGLYVILWIVYVVITVKVLVDIRLHINTSHSFQKNKLLCQPNGNLVIVTLLHRFHRYNAVISSYALRLKFSSYMYFAYIRVKAETVFCVISLDYWLSQIEIQSPVCHGKIK